MQLLKYDTLAEKDWTDKIANIINVQKLQDSEFPETATNADSCVRKSEHL